MILPTDTVYGLCALGRQREPTERLYALKGRDSSQPSALLAADLEMLFECVPELRGRAGVDRARAAAGPVHADPPEPGAPLPLAHAATNPDAIGVRVPELPAAAAERRRRGRRASSRRARTCAGGPDPRRLDEIPPELLERVGAVVDAGELPGTPSTVLDFTGAEPRVIREGAALGGRGARPRLRPQLA